MFQALWADAGFEFANPALELGVQTYSDHVQSVVYNRQTDEIFEVLSGNRQIGVEAPVFKPVY